jgi:hypothetical protein
VSKLGYFIIGGYIGASVCLAKFFFFFFLEEAYDVLFLWGPLYGLEISFCIIFFPLPVLLFFYHGLY